ncbi:MAG: hypothetical protein M1828_001984 [Chrysothrix sp. TS-e1954]|nr:MAG: hypothetical protein M1828_001984 [Chrysothrix sp. TS-e1954]
MSSAGPESPLQKALNEALPLGISLHYFHVSTLPTECAPLYAPAPGQDGERTFIEKQLLLVTTPLEGQLLLDHNVPVFSIEVLIYSTSYLTTLFVSKADSTGYTGTLHVSKETPSILKTLTSTFLAHLVRARQRYHRRLVISLFARSQNTYLFPGSPENSSKHILNDRDLVKWWCRTLDPVVRSYVPIKKGTVSPDCNLDGSRPKTDHRIYSRGSLIVPGHDKYETAAFFPPTVRGDTPERKRWTVGYPMQYLLHNPTAPPRSLVPNYPDDPKARFLDALDEEIPDLPSSQSGKVTDSPSKRGKGMWKSVRSLDQFWEQLAFRQECSSGRLVGFIWCVFTPKDLHSSYTPVSPVLKAKTSRAVSPSPAGHDITDAESASSTAFPQQLPIRRDRSRNHRLMGPVGSREPRMKSSNPLEADSRSAWHTESTTYYVCPKSSRGSLVLPSKGYDRALELLLRLDFANIKVATQSTYRWVNEVAVVSGQPDKDWRVAVHGTRPIPTPESIAALRTKEKASAVKLQPAPTMKIRKKRRSDDSPDQSGDAQAKENSVIPLDADILHKKPRLLANEAEKENSATMQDESSQQPTVASLSTSNEVVQASSPQVRMLDSSLVRKISRSAALWVPVLLSSQSDFFDHSQRYSEPIVIDGLALEIGFTLWRERLWNKMAKETVTQQRARFAVELELMQSSYPDEWALFMQEVQQMRREMTQKRAMGC